MSTFTRNLIFTLLFLIVFFASLIIGVLIGYKYQAQDRMVQTINVVSGNSTPAGEKLNSFVSTLL